MAPRDDWTRFEVEVAVADYLAMLTAELSGSHYVKTKHNRDLQRVLVDRTEGSIEFKHQNISAALLELGYAYIDGYKPRRNYQDLLEEVVAEQLANNPTLEALMKRTVEEEIVLPVPDGDLLSLRTDPPKYEDRPRIVRERRKPTPRLNDWLSIEARNRSLGDAGELWVLRYEEQRLTSEGEPKLAKRIEHLSRTKGDGLGYDILSFEASGRERLIEVKTTKLPKFTPFFVSRNEVKTSSERQDQYHLYRLYSFTKSPKLYTVAGSIGETCRLDPLGYQARVL